MEPFNLLSLVIRGAFFTSLSDPKSAAFKSLWFCKIPFEHNHGFVLIIPHPIALRVWFMLSPDDLIFAAFYFSI